MSLSYTISSIPTGPTITGRPNIIELQVTDSAPTYVRGVEVADATLTSGGGLDIEIKVQGQSFRVKSGVSASFIDNIVTIVVGPLWNTIPPVMLRYFRVSTAAGVSQLIAVNDGDVVTVTSYASANYTLINETEQNTEGTFEVAIYDKTFANYRKLSAYLRGAQVLQGGDETTHASPGCKLDVSALVHAAAMPVVDTIHVDSVTNMVKWCMKAQHSSMDTPTSEVGPCTSIYGVLPVDTAALRIGTNNCILLTFDPRIVLQGANDAPFPVAKYQRVYVWLNALTYATNLNLVSFSPLVTNAVVATNAQAIACKPWESAYFLANKVERYRLRTDSTDFVRLALIDRELCGDYEVLYLLNHFGLPETFVGIIKTIKANTDRLTTSVGYKVAPSGLPNTIALHDNAGAMGEVVDTFVLNITEVREDVANYIMDLLMLGQKAWIQPIRNDTPGVIRPVVINPKSMDKVYNGNAEVYDLSVELSNSSALGANSGV